MFDFLDLSITIKVSYFRIWISFPSYDNNVLLIVILWVWDCMHSTGGTSRTVVLWYVYTCGTRGILWYSWYTWYL